jgi:hypothetical protein
MWATSAAALLLLLGPQQYNVPFSPRAAGACGEDFTAHSAIQGAWDLDDASNGDRLDQSGNGNTLTDANTNIALDTTTYKEGSGSILGDIDAADELVRTDTNLSSDFPGKNSVTTASATWGGFVYLAGVSHNGTVSQKGTGQLGWGFAGGGAGDRLACLMNDGTTRSILTSAKTGSTWYHLVCVYEGGSVDEFCMYVDGSLEGSCVSSVTGTFATGTPDFELGRGGNPAANYDDYAVFASTSDGTGRLSVSEIQDWRDCGIDGTGLP